MDSVLIMRLQAPAKLNLMLHVTARRDDGYHELQTLFQLIDWTDDITLKPREDRRIDYTDTTGGQLDARDNLCVRAAELALRSYPDGCGVAIHLEKHVPWGAGLGGGSSDAAAVLHGLNRLWGAPWDLDELAALGLTLGSDVPLFVYGRTAWAEGLGEKLTPVSRKPGVALILSSPTPVSTAQAYQSLELTQCPAPITMDAAEGYWGSNVFEQPLRARMPEIGERLDWLRQYARAALTGSGGSVFAWFDTQSQAQEILERCPVAWGPRLAASLERSPLWVQGEG